MPLISTHFTFWVYFKNGVESLLKGETFALMEKDMQNHNREWEILQDVRRELISVGIPVSPNIKGLRINTRTKKRLGCCQKEKRQGQHEAYIIEISKNVLGCREEDIRMIMAHELIHTCPGCFDHGKKWKKYASVARERLGYLISRTVSPEDLAIADISREEPRYKITCPVCGQTFIRKRMCPLIRTPERYRCGRCGSSLAGTAIDTISCR